MDVGEVGRCDVKVLEERCQGDEADVLHQSVAHAGPLPRAERDKVFRFDDFTVADETGRIEAERLLPVVGADVELVVVEEHHGAFFDVVTCRWGGGRNRTTVSELETPIKKQKTRRK